MSVAYRPGETVFHRLDPRTKLWCQVAIVAAAYAYTDPLPLVGLTIAVLVALSVLDLSPWRILATMRPVIVLLTIATVVAGVRIGSPWFSLADASETGIAAYRVLLVIVVGFVYVHTTPTRASQAALQWLVPGRIGRGLAVSVGLVGRFLPRFQTTARRIRDAMAIRGGDRMSLHRRIAVFGIVVLAAAVRDADRTSVAMRTRCLSWNPTLPSLSFGRLDYLAIVLGLGLCFLAIRSLL